MLEVQKNLMGLPIVTNVPALLTLRVTTTVSASRSETPGGAAGSGSGSGKAGVGSAATLGAAVGNVARRDPGAQV
jgi:hypothetical protein